MTRDLDELLSHTFHQGFGLSKREEDGFWERFAARMEREAQAWAFFVVAMVRTTSRVRPAVLSSTWASQRSHPAV